MTESNEFKDSLDGGKKMREDLDKIRRWARRRKKKGNDWSSRGGGGREPSLELGGTEGHDSPSRSFSNFDTRKKQARVETRNLKMAKM